jgi:hypothetical protein
MTEAEFAKGHLRDHLGYLLIPPISEGFWSIQKSAVELCERNRTPDQVIRTLQNMFTKIPDWSDITLSTEVERIQTVTKCSYLDDLVMGVFISYMKAFASLNRSSSDITIDFDRPTITKFIHEIYIQSARKLWQVAYLFKTSGVTAEVQARARQEIETIINQCLEQVIRGFLPWDSITKKYFSNQDEPVVEEKKAVSFGDNEEKEFETDDEDDSEDEAPPALTLSEETIALDGVQDEEEDDPIKELERKVSETLVLNL